ncbi:hypothetical protein AWB76_01210 [Caballeronia temeraria]|uniref:Peptidase S8/S53 domain-containing protein n=1 Tax=Caballeronia temeraria TaxID=1777137 RepID=A0A157ZSI2_9BURK|nr:S8 family serine peptidase [Caballeronia temeraria]SAK48504.1 hypothetical protein AWB76_01210 [Caballeronia temeraria]
MAPVWLSDETAAWLLPESKDKVLAVQRLDPYIVWAAATHFVDLGDGPQGFVPIAIETKVGTTARDLAIKIYRKPWMWMSALYRQPPAALANTRFCTAFVTAGFLDELNTSLAGMIERFTLAMPVLAGEPRRTDAVATTDYGGLANTLPANGTFGPAVVGVCDDAIAFAHEHFYADKAGAVSRVRCFWNQDDPSNSAPGLGYGREFLQTDIVKRMSAARRGGVIDEEALYRDAGITALARGWTHGTATLDLAAGADQQRLDPPLPGAAHPALVPALIAVQFRQPGRTVRDTSGLWLDAQALDAFRYIITRTQNIAGASCRAYINMSYGYFAGPHDGSSMLECALDELSKTGTCSITLPAGNSNLDRCHGKLKIAKNTTEALRWRVLPECLTPSFVEIWLPDSDDLNIQVVIEPPFDDGNTNANPNASMPIGPGKVGTWTQNNERLCTVVHRGRGARGHAPMILVAIAPTMTRDPARVPAPNGNWTIKLTNGGNADIEVQAWVQRNETPIGFPPRGRQSRFDDDNYVRFDRYTAFQDYDDNTSPPSWIRREGTLSSIATGFETCVVGGYRREDEATAPYSSTGFDQNGTPPYRAGPDVVAVADRSIVRKGVMAAGTRSGSAVPFEGTSAAAPQMLRMTALAAKQNTLGPPQPIRQHVRQKAAAQTFPGGIDTAGRPLDPDEQKRRKSQGNVGAGNVPPQRNAIEDG